MRPEIWLAAKDCAAPSALTFPSFGLPSCKISPLCLSFPELVTVYEIRYDAILMKRQYAPAVLVMALCVMAGSAFAATWNVTNAVELKAALTAAATNFQPDTIYLKAGVYEVDDLPGTLLAYEPTATDPVENFTLTVEATNGLAIIDGNASKQGMRLETFGVDMHDAHITVRGLRFRECRIFDSDTVGAGLYVRTRWANITIEDCEFQYCTSSHIYDDPSGGGCYARAGSSGIAIVRNCRFLDNSANIYGGGLYMVGNADARIENCTFMRNESKHQGGGLYVGGGISTMIKNCTFYDNSAEDFGGGIYLRLWGDSYSASIQNTIIWTNTSIYTNAADIYFDDDGDGNGTGAVLVVEYCDYVDLGALVGDNITSNYNINADPLLADTNDSNCALLDASPCIDAGTNIVQIVDDIDHIPRPLDGDTNGVALYDIGASEFAHPFGDTDGDGMYDKWEVDGSLDPTDATGENGPGGNPDSDAGSNWSEFISDTDPNASASLLQVMDIGTTGGNARISWQGGQVVTQYIDCATNLLEGPAGWITIFTNMPPTLINPVVVDSNTPPGSAFYRIRTTR